MDVVYERKCESMASRLKGLVFDFVSLVPRGANEYADVVLAKRDDPEGDLDSDLETFVNKTDPTGESVHVDTPLGSKTKKKKKDTDPKLDTHEEDEDMDEELNKGDGTTSGDEGSTLHSMPDSTGLPEGLSPAAIEYIEKLEDLVIEKDGVIAKLSQDDQHEDLSKEDNDVTHTLEELAKSDPAIAELVAKYEEAEARASEAETIAKAERDTRITAQMVRKAEGYASLGPVEEVAEILKALHDTDTELFDKVDALLAKAEAAVAEGDLFKEIGATASDPSVGNDLEQVAKALKAEDPTLTDAQAITKALDQRPDLYTGGK